MKLIASSRWSDDGVSPSRGESVNARMKRIEVLSNYELARPLKKLEITNRIITIRRKRQVPPSQRRKVQNGPRPAKRATGEATLRALDSSHAPQV